LVIGYWLLHMVYSSRRSRPLPVYREPDKTLKSLSAEPQNLQPLEKTLSA
jgi:hypothetical protein